jgi:glycosyltransferase involved in cell wall biosynthesis
VVGSGTRFLSGVSIYTIRLANVLAVRGLVTVITMRRLLPARLYPGRARVGADLTDLEHDPNVTVIDGVDWFWGVGMIRAVVAMLRTRPQFMILQWWTGTVLHTYLALALVARLRGVRIIVEFHEIIESGEARLRFARRYIELLAPILMRLADAFVVHSDFDRELVRQHFPIRGRPVAVLKLGPFDHYRAPASSDLRVRHAPEDVCNLLFFGVIRPYKGLEHLIAAFDSLSPDEVRRYWLTVVGETWEGWTLPAEAIARSPYRERITFIDRYVHDRELNGLLAGADAVVLPYLRSSLSGPLHVAMGYGVPIVISDVGGNAEAAGGYGGILLVPPADPDAIRRAILELSALRHERFAPPTSWDETAGAYEALFHSMLSPKSITTVRTSK